MFLNCQRFIQERGTAPRLIDARQMSLPLAHYPPGQNPNAEVKHTWPGTDAPLSAVTFSPSGFLYPHPRVFKLKRQLGSVCSSVMQTAWDGTTEQGVSRRASRKSAFLFPVDSVLARGSRGPAHECGLSYPIRKGRRYRMGNRLSTAEELVFAKDPSW